MAFDVVSVNSSMFARVPTELREDERLDAVHRSTDMSDAASTHPCPCGAHEPHGRLTEFQDEGRDGLAELAYGAAGPRARGFPTGQVEGGTREVLETPGEREPVDANNTIQTRRRTRAPPAPHEWCRGRSRRAAPSQPTATTAWTRDGRASGPTAPGVLTAG
ncbi:hypothetical protein GCM10023215_45260 [Pseudonocardia yuanmonensis]|uniref:Uncharacterized protein n=1 Tax=Pseudonocardia yuanmonensis TaxID=1095914 RepID=A0ABP8X7I4_9PSEU